MTTPPRPKPHIPATLLLAALALLPLIGCASNLPTTRKSESLLAQLPGPARYAAERESAGGGIRKVHSEEFEGRTVYYIAFTNANRKSGILEVTGDGRILSREIELESVPLAKVPDPVREGLRIRTGGAKPGQIFHEQFGQRDVYVISVIVGATEHEFMFDADGTLLREETALNPAQLPITVTSALSNRPKHLDIAAAAEVREGETVYYSVTATSEGRVIQALVYPDGRFRAVRDLSAR